jgi:hypothetical protein
MKLSFREFFWKKANSHIGRGDAPNRATRNPGRDYARMKLRVPVVECAQLSFCSGNTLVREEGQPCMNAEEKPNQRNF